MENTELTNLVVPAVETAAVVSAEIAQLEYGELCTVPDLGEFADAESRSSILLPNGDKLVFVLDEGELSCTVEQSEVKPTESKTDAIAPATEPSVKPMPKALRAYLKTNHPFILGYVDIEYQGVIFPNMTIKKSKIDQGIYARPPQNWHPGSKNRYYEYRFKPEIYKDIEIAACTAYIAKVKETMPGMPTPMLSAGKPETAVAPAPNAAPAEAPQAQTKPLEVKDDFDLTALAIRAEKALYSSAAQLNGVPIRTAKSGARYVSLSGYAFIQQNTKTNSDTARKALDGTLIVWVVRETPGQTKGEYLGHTENGVYVPNVPRTPNNPPAKPVPVQQPA